jgi:uncharacterized protein YndB with AHSA1/START domain
MSNKISVTVETSVKAPIEKAWKYWSKPEHIVNWNNASDDWHTPKAENDLRTGGKFSSRMEARDGSQGFDFGGVYDNVETNKLIEYSMGDGRKVKVIFSEDGDQTQITETFEVENTHPIQMQKEGWQAILDNFKKYIETN